MLSFIYLYFIALGLATKTFAVAVLSSTLKPIGLKTIIKIALIFAIVQAVMVVIGWFAGILFFVWLEQYSTSLAYSIIVIVGVKMIIGTFKLKSRIKIVDTSNNSELIILAIAIGIDIFIVGMGLGLAEIPVLSVFVVMGIIVFLMSIVGASFGKKYPMKYGNLVEFGGGLILVFIGIRNLIGFILC